MHCLHVDGTDGIRQTTKINVDKPPQVKVFLRLYRKVHRSRGIGFLARFASYSRRDRRKF